MVPCCKLTSTQTCVSNKKRIPYFFNQTPQLLFILLLVLYGYYLRTATIRGWRLFLWKAQRQRQLDKVWRVRRWRLLDAVSSMHSLSALLSAVETTHTRQTVLALAWRPSSEIICTRVRVCVLRLLAAATIQGWCLFRSRALDCVATIWGRRLIEKIQYLLSTNHPTKEFDLSPQL